MLLVVVGSFLGVGTGAAAAASSFRSADVDVDVGRNAMASGRSLLDASGLSVVVRDDGRLMLSEAPESRKRPFKIAFYYDFDPVEALDVVEHIRGTVMPTIASLLGRWVRVRLHDPGRTET